MKSHGRRLLSGAVFSGKLSRALNNTVMQHLTKCLLAVMVATAVYAEDGASWALYEKAIKTDSTAPNYVLITVVDTKANRSYVICTEAPFLLAAIHHEQDIEFNEAGSRRAEAFALKQKNRIFQFSKPGSLKNIEPRYPERILNEVREILKRYSNDELIRGFTGKKTELSKLYNEQSEHLYGAYRDAIAHVLLERGLLPRRGCSAGFLTVEK